MSFEKQLLERIERSRDTSPGAYNLAADLLDLAVIEAEGWTKRSDDAVRIPDRLYDGVRALREAAESKLV